MLEKLALVALAALTPVSELRASIPLGIVLGLNPLVAFATSIAFCSLVFFPTYFLAEFFYLRLFSKIGFFRRFIMDLRKHASPYLQKYGTLGLIALVAVPPTGVYTASLIGWLFNIRWRRAFAAIVLGAFLSGVAILAISLGILKLAF